MALLSVLCGSQFARVHARIEDCIRTAKDTGSGKFSSQAFALDQAWLTAATR
jgi:hypothetical protein